MSKTAPKTTKKPTQAKPVREYRIKDQLIMISNRLRDIESKVRDDSAFRTLVQSLVADHNGTALESRSAPAEEWVPKVGDKIVRSDRCLEGSDAKHHPLEIGQVGTIKAVWSDRLSVCEHMDGINYYYQWRFRAATFAEIADHKAKEEQRAIAKRLEDERTKELAKVPEFGTRVKFMEHVKEEQEGLIASELDPSGYIISYRVPDGRWFTIRKKRHEFTILD